MRLAIVLRSFAFKLSGRFGDPRLLKESLSMFSGSFAVNYNTNRSILADLTVNLWPFANVASSYRKVTFK